MKTKLLIPLFAIVTSIGTIFANGTEIDGICYVLDNSNMTASVTYRGSSYYSNEYKASSFIIPESVTYTGQSYNVTSIGNQAFFACNSITTIVIPNSVKSIGTAAFERCNNLTSLIIPNSVTSIGPNAFYDCYKLTSINIPDGVTSIGGGTFDNCTSLTTITIPESITSIDGMVFYNCTSLTNIVWNAKNCADFGSESNTLFYYYYVDPKSHYATIKDIRTQITSLVFGKEVEHIPAYLCCGLGNLTSITIPESVTSIGASAFAGCGISSITIPNSVTSIGAGAFRGCGITSVTIPSSVTSIGNGAFNNCNNLNLVYCELGTPVSIGETTFPNTATIYIPNCAFSAFSVAPVWKDLTLAPVSVNLSVVNNTGGVVVENCGQMEIEAIPYIGYQFRRWQDGNKENPRKYTLTQTNRNFIAEFEVAKYQITLSCDADQGSIIGDQGKFVYESEHTIEAVANYGYHFTQWSDGETENPRTFVLEQDTTFTAEFAKNTYSIETHANAEQGSVTGLSEGEYLDEISLTAVPVDGYRFSQWQDGNTDNPRYFILTQDTVFTAEFVLDVNFNCGNDWLLTWDYNADTKTLTISGEGAFNENMECSLLARAELETLVFAEGVTSIGANAFANCVTLQTLELSSTVKKINENAFYNCENLIAIYNHRPTPTNALSSAFDGVDKFECVLYVPAASVSMYRNAAVWSEFYNIRAIQSTPTVIDVVGTNGNTDGYLKFIRNGQLLILRDGKTYTVQGQEVR